MLMLTMMPMTMVMLLVSMGGDGHDTMLRVICDFAIAGSLSVGDAPPTLSPIAPTRRWRGGCLRPLARPDQAAGSVRLGARPPLARPDQASPGARDQRSVAEDFDCKHTALRASTVD